VEARASSKAFTTRVLALLSAVGAVATASFYVWLISDQGSIVDEGPIVPLVTGSILLAAGLETLGAFGGRAPLGAAALAAGAAFLVGLGWIGIFSIGIFLLASAVPGAVASVVAASGGVRELGGTLIGVVLGVMMSAGVYGLLL
jgi:hypothetical protein